MARKTEKSLHRARTSGTKDAQRSMETTSQAGRVTVEEIREILADEGYSGDQRKAQLKALLTELTDSNTKLPEDVRAELAKEVKTVLDEHQDGKPSAKDTL